MRLDLYEQGGYAGGGISENGGNISGPLLLAGNPSQTLEAVPKQYVDAYFNSVSASNLTGGTLSAARLPALTGDLQTVEGGSVFTLANSGVIPGSYGKVTVNAKGIVTSGGNLTDADIPFGVDWSKINSNTLPTTLSGYGILDGVSSAGGTLTGFLTLSQNPTLSTHAATKQYVDSLVSGGGIAVGDILRKPYSTTPAGFLKCNGAEVNKTTYANLYAVIGDNFVQNSIPGAGRPWQQQYDINATQSIEIIGWVTETALPSARYTSSAIVTKNRVYFCGGTNGSAYSSAVYTAPINADGTLGVWTTGSPLPGVLGVSQAIVTKNRVYLLGGENASTVSTNVVYTAVINDDGTLGTWVTDTSLPGVLAMSQAVITKNRVYLLGGVNASAYIGTVYTAPINSDGTLGAWTTGTALPEAIAQSQFVVTKNRVYLLGGRNTTTFLSTVYTAAINSDGTLGSWVADLPLPNAMAAAQVLVTKNTVYLFGGATASATYITTCYKTKINSDGTLGTWTVTTPLPSALGHSQTIVTNNRVYLLGGWNGTSALATIYSASINGGLNDYSGYYQDDNLTNYMMPGSGKPWQKQYQINTTQSTDITGWTAGTALPAAIGAGQVIVTSNRVYLLGGGVGAGMPPTAAVYTAAINSDGTLGTWTAGTALPIVLAQSQSIVTKNRVYLLGGYNGTAAVSNVYTAPINLDGTIGTWVADLPLPGGIFGSQAVVTKNRVYLLGGSNATTILSTVYTAPINADGTIGAWVIDTSLPGPLYSSSVIITKNRVYICSGQSSSTSTFVSTVYTATINSDGVIGVWSTANSLPGALYGSQAVVTSNRAYLLGGYNGTSWTTTVYTAPISSDGTLGTWTTGTSIPSILDWSQAIILKNRIYLLGGWNGTVTVSTVYTASFSSDINDYSPYFDGTIVPNDLVINTSKFVLPDFSADEPFGSYSYIKY